MRRSEWIQRFFTCKTPTINPDLAREFIANRFGFDRSFTEVKRSYYGKVFYPLFLNENLNFIIFSVKGVDYQCVDGKLRLLHELG